MGSTITRASTAVMRDSYYYQNIGHAPLQSHTTTYLYQLGGHSIARCAVAYRLHCSLFARQHQLAVSTPIC